MFASVPSGSSATRATPVVQSGPICADGGSASSSPAQRRESWPCVRFDRVTCQERNQIERSINRLYQDRAIATRYEKLAVTFHTLLTSAAIRVWLNV